MRKTEENARRGQHIFTWNISHKCAAMFTIKELDDFSCYQNVPIQSLVTLCAKTCVLNSEHLLGQLENIVLPMELCRILVETFQNTGSHWNGIHSRFFAALKDASGTSPWVFPGNPLIFPDTKTGPPSTVCLQYNLPVDGSVIKEVKRQEERISGIVCDTDYRGDDNMGRPTTFLKLKKLVTYSFNRFIVSDKLTCLHLDSFQCRHKLNDLHAFPNLESLTIHCLPDEIRRHDLSPLFMLTKLKHLDLQRYGQILNAKETLTTILTVMPEMEYLDISETNLDEGDLHGLFELRSSRPLKFLGLYDTTHQGCLLPNIPADVISGTANKQQRAAALETMNSQSCVEKILRSLQLSPKTRVNYIIQLLQCWTTKHYQTPLFISDIMRVRLADLPPPVLTVLFDAIVHYVQQSRSTVFGYEMGKLQTILLANVHKICTMNPSLVGRLLAYFVTFCWSSYRGDREPLNCGMFKFDEKKFEHLLNVEDDDFICILNILNCQMKNVVRYLEVQPDYTWTKTTGSRMCVMRKVHSFVIRLFEKVNHSAIEEFKHLFGRIEAWESATWPTVEVRTELRKCQRCCSNSDRN